MDGTDVGAVQIAEEEERDRVIGLRAKIEGLPVCVGEREARSRNRLGEYRAAVGATAALGADATAGEDERREEEDACGAER